MAYDYSQVLLDSQDIIKIIPHRDPFLLIEAVHELEIGKKIVTSKLLAENEPVFQGHFPGHPIYPGVYYIEAIAQSGSVLFFASHKEKTIGYSPSELLGFLTSVDEVRFRRRSVPTERVRYEVEIERVRGPFIWMKGQAFVDDKIAVQCKISIALGEWFKQGKIEK